MGRSEFVPTTPDWISNSEPVRRVGNEKAVDPDRKTQNSVASAPAPRPCARPLPRPGSMGGIDVSGRDCNLISQRAGIALLLMLAVLVALVGLFRNHRSAGHFSFVEVDFRRFGPAIPGIGVRAWNAVRSCRHHRPGDRALCGVRGGADFELTWPRKLPANRPTIVGISILFEMYIDSGRRNVRADDPQADAGRAQYLSGDRIRRSFSYEILAGWRCRPNFRGGIKWLSRNLSRMQENFPAIA